MAVRGATVAPVLPPLYRSASSDGCQGRYCHGAAARRFTTIDAALHESDGRQGATEGRHSQASCRVQSIEADVCLLTSCTA